MDAVLALKHSITANRVGPAPLPPPPAPPAGQPHPRPRPSPAGLGPPSFVNPAPRKCPPSLLETQWPPEDIQSVHARLLARHRVGQEEGSGPVPVGPRPVGRGRTGPSWRKWPPWGQESGDGKGGPACAKLARGAGERRGAGQPPPQGQLAQAALRAQAARALVCTCPRAGAVTAVSSVPKETLRKFQAWGQAKADLAERKTQAEKQAIAAQGGDAFKQLFHQRRRQELEAQNR